MRYGILRRRRTVGLLAVTLLAAAIVVALVIRREHTNDTRDAITISRAFIVATWTGNSAQVEALSCPDVGWSLSGDPSLTIDAEHLTFALVSQTDQQAVVEMGGIVTFKGEEGQIETRDLDQLGQTRFTLEQHGGWKVCDVR